MVTNCTILGATMLAGFAMVLGIPRFSFSVHSFWWSGMECINTATDN